MTIMSGSHCLSLSSAGWAGSAVSIDRSTEFSEAGRDPGSDPGSESEESPIEVSEDGLDGVEGSGFSNASSFNVTSNGLFTIPCLKTRKASDAAFAKAF